MSTLHEQARAEAEKRFPDTNPLALALAMRDVFQQGFLAGHEAASRPRQVTARVEHDAQAFGSVVLNTRGDAWQKRGTSGRWYVVGLPGGQKEVPYLPARVLYVPEEES